MKEASAKDAVGYFGDNVEEFHGLYRSSPGFQERLRFGTCSSGGT